MFVCVGLLFCCFVCVAVVVVFLSLWLRYGWMCLCFCCVVWSCVYFGVLGCVVFAVLFFSVSCYVFGLVLCCCFFCVC